MEATNNPRDLAGSEGMAQDGVDISSESIVCYSPASVNTDAFFVEWE